MKINYKTKLSDATDKKILPKHQLLKLLQNLMEQVIFLDSFLAIFLHVNAICCSLNYPYF